jgi:hypothetical protein
MDDLTVLVLKQLADPQPVRPAAESHARPDGATRVRTASVAALKWRNVVADTTR